MAYDEDLADRIRELVGGEERLTEQRMFGGLAFLLAGNMAIAASGEGGLLVRADPATSAALLEDGVTPMVMRGRPMKGWLRVEASRARTKPQLKTWVAVGTSYARTLPPKSK